MHGQRDLWRNVNEPLAQQKAHRPGGVIEEPVQLLNRALLTILLTEAQNQLLNLLSAWGTLESKEKAYSITGHMRKHESESYHFLVSYSVVSCQTFKKTLTSLWVSLIAQLVKNPPTMQERPQFNSWVGKIRWRRDRLPTPVFMGFPCGSAGEESAHNAGDLGSSPGLGRFPGEGKGYPLQCSGLENPMDCISPRGPKELDTTERLSLYKSSVLTTYYFSKVTIYTWLFTSPYSVVGGYTNSRHTGIETLVHLIR